MKNRSTGPVLIWHTAIRIYKYDSQIQNEPQYINSLYLYGFYIDAQVCKILSYYEHYFKRYLHKCDRTNKLSKMRIKITVPLKTHNDVDVT